VLQDYSKQKINDGRNTADEPSVVEHWKLLFADQL